MCLLLKGGGQRSKKKLIRLHTWLLEFQKSNFVWGINFSRTVIRKICLCNEKGEKGLIMPKIIVSIYDNLFYFQSIR